MTPLILVFLVIKHYIIFGAYFPFLFVTHQLYHNTRYIRFTDDNFYIDDGVYNNSNRISALFSELYDELNNRPEHWQDMIAYKMNELYICIKRLSAHDTTQNSPVNLIKNYIDENYVQNLNIHDLALQAGYSDSQFRLLFTQAFGISPRNYIIKKRCEQAIELLKFTEYSCADIAYQCGFYDASQLAKLLKRNYSSSPGIIRKEKSN